MTPDADNCADHRPQFSLRQLWIVVSACGLLFAVPFFAMLLLWLVLQLGLAAAILIAVILVQAPCFFLFKALKLLPSESSQNDD